MAIIIPTANRHKAIDMWLYTAAYGMQYIGVDIIVFDSSADDRTEAIVNNFIIDGCTNIRYVRWQGEWDGFSLDNKVIDAYKMFCDEYEYLWALRDGLIIHDSAVVKKELFPAISRGNDFIVINATCRDYNHFGNRQYENCVDLFSEQLMQMTILGATIVKGSVIKKVIQKVPNEKGKTYGLWQPMSFFYYMAEEGVKVESIVDDIWIYNTSGATSSFLGKNTFKQWCEIWCELINNLPPCYDKHKKQAKYIYMSDFHPFQAVNLLSVRANRGLNIAEVNRCRHNLPDVCKTPVLVFYIIALLPCCVADYLRKNMEGSLFRLLSAIYYFAFGIVPGEKEVLA